MLDSWVDIGLRQMLVPFTSSWNPVAVSWGVVGLYLLAAVEVTSLLRSRLPKRWWKGVHLSSYGLYVVATVHFLTAGTDASSPVLLWTVAGRHRGHRRPHRLPRPRPRQGRLGAARRPRPAPVAGPPEALRPPTTPAEPGSGRRLTAPSPPRADGAGADVGARRYHPAHVRRTNGRGRHTVERLAIDLLAPELYAGDPYPTYAWMRANEPVYWDEVNELWGIARYDDIVRIEKDKATFINSDKEKGGYRPNLPADAAIIGLDDPLHSKRRNLVSRRFTPRAASAWEDDIRAKVTRLLDAVQAKGGTAEIVDELAAPLPAMMIGKLLGFDEDDWPKLKHWSETTIAMGGGPRYFNEVGMTSAMEFAQACAELFAAKRETPATTCSATTPPPRSTAARWTRARSSPTRCCCSTVAPRPPARSSPTPSSTCRATRPSSRSSATAPT